MKFNTLLVFFILSSIPLPSFSQNSKTFSVDNKSKNIFKLKFKSGGYRDTLKIGSDTYIITYEFKTQTESEYTLSQIYVEKGKKQNKFVLEKVDFNASKFFFINGNLSAIGTIKMDEESMGKYDIKFASWDTSGKLINNKTLFKISKYDGSPTVNTTDDYIAITWMDGISSSEKSPGSNIMNGIYKPVDDKIYDAKKIGTIPGDHKGLLRIESGIHENILFVCWGYKSKTGQRDEFVVKVNMEGDVVGDVVSLGDIFVTRVISCGENVFAIHDPKQIFKINKESLKFDRIEIGSKNGFWNDAICTNDHIFITWWEEDSSKSSSSANLTIVDTTKMSYEVKEKIFIKTKKQDISSEKLKLYNKKEQYKIFLKYESKNKEIQIQEYNINYN